MISDTFWTSGLENEPCDCCGIQPSKHLGHGSYTCEKCWNERWCQNCSYPKDSDVLMHEGKHVCPSPEQFIAWQKELRAAFEELGLVSEYEDALNTVPDAYKEYVK